MRKRSSQRTSNFDKMRWLQMPRQNSHPGNRLKVERQKDKGSGGHLIKLLSEGGIHFNKSDSFARGLECLYLSCFVCSLAFGLLYFLPQDACGLLMENIREQHQDVPHSACCCQQPPYPCLVDALFILAWLPGNFKRMKFLMKLGILGQPQLIRIAVW